MILGIDLGTTNTSAAIIKNSKPIFVKTNSKENSLLLPSIVSYVDQNEFIVGEEALKKYISNPESTVRSIKSLMGTSQEVSLKNQKTGETELFTPVEISAQILSEIKKLAELQFGIPIEKAVISVPAYFNDKARKDTIKAGELAGFEVMRIINEPTAAALSYGVQNKKLKNKYVMVYDLGGGTFDTSIIEINDDVIEVIASDGDRALGGDDFDYALFSHLYEVFKSSGNHNIAKKSKLEKLAIMAKLLKATEETKKNLSSSAKCKFSIPDLKIKEIVYREELDKVIGPLINKTVRHCIAVIEKSMLNATDIDKILLVGGSSRIPAVRKSLENELNIPVSQEADPDLAVVTGAAIQAAILEGQNVDSVLLDVAPHSLSVACVMEKNGKTIPNYCSKLIKKNTPIPCSVEEIYSTVSDKQTSVRIAIYQGESDFEEGNVLVKELKFDCVSSKKAKDMEIAVKFSYRLDGTIDVHLSEEGTDNKTKHSFSLLKDTQQSQV